MKISKVVIISIILISIFTLSAVSANDVENETVLNVESSDGYDLEVEDTLSQIPEDNVTVDVPTKVVANENSEITVTSDNSDFQENVSAFYTSNEDGQSYWNFAKVYEIGKANFTNGVSKLPFSLPYGDWEVKVVVGDKEFFKEVFVRDIRTDEFDINANVPKEIPSYYSGEYPIKISLPKGSNGYFKVLVDGEVLTNFKYKSNKNFEFEYYRFTKGNHTMEFRYTGDSYYQDLNKTYDFSIQDVVLYIPDEIVLGKEDKVVVSLPGDAKGDVIITVDGVKYQYSYADYFGSYDGSFTVSHDLSNLDVSQHEIEVQFVNDSKYPQASKKAVVNTTYFMSCAVSTNYIDGDELAVVTIKVYFPSDAKSQPLVSLDGVAVGKVSPLGFLSLKHVAYGEHTLTISYQDEKYPLKVFNKTFTVKVGIYAPNVIYYNRENHVYVDLPVYAKGDLVIYDKFSGEIYKSVSLQDTNFIVIDDLPVGIYRVYIRYTGDDYKVDDLRNHKFEVYSFVDVPSRVKLGDEEYIRIYSDKYDSRALKVFVNDNYYDTIQLKNGEGKLSLSKVPLGVNYVQIETFENECPVAVYKEPRLIGGKDIIMFYGDGSKYYVKVYGIYGKIANAGEIVKFTVGGKNYYSYINSKGYAYLSLPFLVGKYTIKATYLGFSVKNTLLVKQVLTLKSVKVKKSSSLTLSATLQQAKGDYLKYKWVKFDFNGKSYYAKTNKYGVAKVTIAQSALKNLKVGKTVTYQATYIKDVVRKSVKVLG